MVVLAVSSDRALQVGSYTQEMVLMAGHSAMTLGRICTVTVDSDNGFKRFFCVFSMMGYLY